MTLALDSLRGCVALVTGGRTPPAAVADQVVDTILADPSCISTHATDREAIERRTREIVEADERSVPGLL